MEDKQEEKMAGPEPNQVATVEQPQDQSAAVMTMLSNAVAEGRDIATLEKLMDLQERVLNRNAKNAFAADFVRMRPHLPKVIRSKKNKQTDSMYAPLEDINVGIDPVLEKYGFSTATKVVNQTDTSVTVKAELWHRDGHVEETQITMPLDRTGIAGTVNKTGPHALSSSVTYAKRVAICALLNVSTGDDKDGNTDQGQVTTEQAVEIDLKLRECAKTYGSPDNYIANFFKLMNVKDAREVRAKDYKKALNTLKPKATEQSP